MAAERFQKGGFGFSLEGLDVVVANLNKWTEGVVDKRKRIADRLTAMSVPYMQSHAPWHDRTQMARDSLYAVTDHQPTYSVITISHGPAVDYGIFLETMQGGRFGVLLPTLGFMVFNFKTVAMEELAV